MKYLLDTNAWIRYVNKPRSAIARKLPTLQPDDVRLCSVVLGELYYGAYKSSRPANLNVISTLSRQFASLPFDDAAAVIYGRIRAQLATAGALIGPYDLQIAAIALANNLTVVTRNTQEFSRVPGLVIEDWEATP